MSVRLLVCVPARLSVCPHAVGRATMPCACAALWFSCWW